MIQKQYDLEQRTTKFSEDLIDFVITCPSNSIINPIISQLVRSGTSVGANYCEADDTESKMDFKHKIGIAKKEARETKYWLGLISKLCIKNLEILGKLKVEIGEIHLILNSIYRKIQK